MLFILLRNTMNIKKIQFEFVYYGILLCIHITLEVIVIWI